jgi:hypothetical protein
MNLQDLLFKPAELKAGETKIINGAIAVCINPHASRGPLWAIKGRCAMFTGATHSRYVEGVCRNVSPDKGFITMEIIKGPYPVGTLLNFTFDEIRRYNNVTDEDDAYMKKVLAHATSLARPTAEPLMPSLMELKDAAETEFTTQNVALLKSLIGTETYQWVNSVSCTFNEINALAHNNHSRNTRVTTAIKKQAQKLNALLAKQPLQNQ